MVIYVNIGVQEKRYKVVVTVKDIKGQCSFGYKLGDKIEFHQHPDYDHVPKIVGKVCPEAHANLYRNAFCMLYGGRVPWAKNDRTIAQTVCPDPFNLTTFELKQVPIKAKNKK